MGAHRRTQRLIAAVDRRQREGGGARAEDERRHHDVQAVETSGGQEARDGLRAALDHDAAKAACRQAGEQRCRRDMAVVGRQA